MGPKQSFYFQEEVIRMPVDAQFPPKERLKLPGSCSEGMITRNRRT